MKIQEYFVKYDIDSKTQTVIKNDEVVDTVRHEFCPYVWFGKLKKEIESGIVKFVMFKKSRLVPD